MFHVVSTALLVWGTYALVRNRQQVVPREALGWIVLAAGAFNLYDGTIQHKIFAFTKCGRERRMTRPMTWFS